MIYDHDKYKFNVPKDAPQYMRDLQTQLRNTLKDIAIVINSVNPTASTPTVDTSATNTSTGGTSTTTLDLRANSVAVIAGDNLIVFSSPMTRDYVIIPIYITSRAIEFIDPTQIIYTMAYFTVSVPEAGTLVYTVIPKI